jgi:serine/threonine protein kinase
MNLHQEATLYEWVSVSPLTIRNFLDISVMLTEMVYNIHKQNETIGALNPKNITIRAHLKQAVITDTTRWSAAYQSPECTGTINRVPDARSDLYSLGVIFNELLTGRLPIQPSSAKGDWAFSHVVELPQPITMHQSELEGPIQAIVMKLLAKSPDARYQSANITRTELAVMIARAYSTEAVSAAISGFADDSEIPAWARSAVSLAKELGIVSGKKDNKFAPQDTATRAEAVTMIINLLQVKK